MSSMEFRGGRSPEEELLKAKLKVRLPIGKEEQIGSALFFAISSLVFIVVSSIAFTTKSLSSDIIVPLIGSLLFSLVGFSSLMYYLADFYLAKHERKIYKVSVKGESVEVELEVSIDEAELHLRELVAVLSIPAVDHVENEKLSVDEEGVPLWLRAELEREPDSLESVLKRLELPYKLTGDMLELFIEAPKVHNSSVISVSVFLIIVGLLFSGSTLGLFIILVPIFTLGILAIYKAISLIINETGRRAYQNH